MCKVYNEKFILAQNVIFLMLHMWRILTQNVGFCSMITTSDFYLPMDFL
jgi:hypothetical protein